MWKFSTFSQSEATFHATQSLEFFPLALFTPRNFNCLEALESRSSGLYSLVDIHDDKSAIARLYAFSANRDRLFGEKIAKRRKPFF